MKNLERGILAIMALKALMELIVFVAELLGDAKQRRA